MSCLSAFFLLSCEKDKPVTKTDPVSIFGSGVFICNEGPYMNGTGTVSFMSFETGQVSNDLFEAVNHRPLGNIVQSMEIYKDRGYIIVNNANRVEVVDMTDFHSAGAIENLTLPRFFLGIDDRRAYISCWDNTVAVLNVMTLMVEKRIPTQTGPERMLRMGDRVFVLNQGGYSIDSSVTVINTNSDLVITNLKVYPKPTGIVADREGKIWIMCSGKGYNGWPAGDDTEGHLLRIDPQTLTIIKDFPFPDKSLHPEKLAVNSAGDQIFYLYKNGIYNMGLNQDVLPAQALVERAGYTYTFGMDTASGYLYLSDPVDFVQDGWVYRYQSTTGLPVDSFKVGIIPTYFCFK
ncbi:MAG: hypothetical protein NTU44_04050 [Bacteroidetes bacterium]|nr:hypothetical protein [Bacteroidota bacterium]